MPDLLTPTAPDTVRPPVDNDVLYEVIDGAVREKSTGAFEGWIADRLQQLLARSEIVYRLGHVSSENLFLLDAARPLKRRPDLAFISFERWPRRRRVPREEAWPVIPDLAIEVVSKSNSAPEVLDKVNDDFTAGVRLVWVIYPVRQLIYVYRSQTVLNVLKPGDDLDGGDVLPGFRVPLTTLFEDDAEPDDQDGA